MAAGLYTLIIEQGTTLRRTFQCEQADGAPVDFTGSSARLQVRRTKASNDPILDLKSDDGSLIIDGPAGEISLFVSDSVTSALSFESGYYDLEVQYPTGVVDRIVEGRACFSKEVTR